MANRRQRLWHELQLLCRVGIGVEPIAPALAAIIRQIVGAEACAVFWLDESGNPEGFFHEDSPADVRDIFLNEYDRLFRSDSEVNISALATYKGKAVGWLAAPEKSYFNSNTFNLLVRASGHHHTLDLRVDVRGRPRAVIALFRVERQPFATTDAEELARVAPYVERAILSRADGLGWRPEGAPGHVLMDPAGARLLLVDDNAEALLKRCEVVGQNVRLAAPIVAPPQFLVDVCLGMGDYRATATHLPIPSGRLAIRAHRMRSPVADAGQVMITLQLETSRDLELLRNILDLEISPMQREIVLLAGQGVSRQESLRRIGISNEAMKKHLAAIYAIAGTNRWEDLAAFSSGSAG